MKNIAFILTFSLACLVAQAQTFNIELLPNPSNNRELLVKLTPSNLITTVTIEQIVFTIQWQASTGVTLGNIVSNHAVSSDMLKNGGTATESGITSQKFLMPTTKTLTSLTNGEAITIATIPITGGSGTPSFSIPAEYDFPTGNWFMYGKHNTTVDVLDMQGTITNSAAALIVLSTELLSFQAQKDGKTSVLNWDTVSEKNLYGYTIERSEDGKAFMPIGLVFAKGQNPTEKVSYQFVDDKPVPSINYYRLKMEDKDKTFKYSKVVSVDFLDKISTKIYPNPFDRDVMVDIELPQSNHTGGILLEVMDAAGRVLFTKRIKDAGRKTSINIPADDYATGNYIVRMTNGVDVWQQKITKY